MIYGSRGRAPTREDDCQAKHDKHNHAQAENRRRTPSELRLDLARYRGAAHPLCFTDEVMEQEFPEGFKTVNIESYDGTTDPAVWIEDFLLHIHMARGDDLHAIKYLPLNSKDQRGIGFIACQRTPLAVGKIWKPHSSTTFRALMCGHQMPMT